MDNAVKKFRSLRFAWNKKPRADKELYRLARRLKVKIQEMPLKVPGFYMKMRGVYFIAINERLNEELKLKIKFHELAHHILHTGQPHFYLLDPTMKEECEAEVFALCCMIPLTWVKTKTIRELHEDYGFSLRLIHERKDIHEQYKRFKV